MTTQVADRITVVSSLLVEHEGRLLLGRRCREPGVGCWIPPGGKVRPGEGLTEAGVREIREETGLEVKVTGRPGAGGAFEFAYGGRLYLIVYSCAEVTAGDPRPGDDIDDLRFCTKADLIEWDDSSPRAALPETALRLGCTARQALVHNGWLSG